MSEIYEFTCRRCGVVATATKHRRGNKRQYCEPCAPLHRLEWERNWTKADSPGLKRWQTKHRSKSAQRRTWLKYAYDITPEEWQAMSDAQGGRCALCLALPTGRGLMVDHCHTTKRVRGLLCAACNSTLGKWGDTADRVVAYCNPKDNS